MIDKQPSQNAMDKIMRGEVKQIPRWRFVVRNIILWSLGILCIFAGAITVSLIIFTFANSAFSMRDVVYKSFLQHAIVFIPFLWIAGTLLFIGLFKFSVRHTKRGYKYSLTSILAVSFLASVIVGIIFYFFGLSHITDDILGTHFRSYHSVEMRQAKIFDNPEKGTIIGRITEINNQYFVLVTPSGDSWTIMNEYIPEFKKKFIIDGERFVVIGKKMDNEVFVACDVRKRGMVGANQQVQQRHMQKIQQMKNCDETKCMHKYMQEMPKNMDVLVKAACEHVQ